MRASLGWLALMALVATGGCARSPRGIGGARPAMLGLEVVEPGELAPDASQVGTLGDVDLVLGYPRPAAPFHALGPVECQCLAARNSTLGNLLDGERRAVQAQQSGCGAHGDSEPRDDVLRTAALEARNQSAGDALRAYYRLAQSEVRVDLIDQGYGEARRAADNVDRMRQQGLRLPPDESAFDRRAIALADQQAELQIAIDRLNAQLWQLTGIVPDAASDRIWPTTDLIVVVEPIDVEAEVQWGLANRPELGLLRRLCGSLDTNSLPAARAALSQAGPLLGLAPDDSSCDGVLGLIGALKKIRAANRELPERQRQLARYTRQREGEIASEIRVAALAAEQRLRQVALAKEALALAGARESDTTSRSATGGATFADVATARLALVEARGDLLDKVIEWRLALVQLKQSQGLLVRECCR